MQTLTGCCSLKPPLNSGVSKKNTRPPPHTHSHKYTHTRHAKIQQSPFPSLYPHPLPTALVVAQRECGRGCPPWLQRYLRRALCGHWVLAPGSPPNARARVLRCVARHGEDGSRNGGENLHPGTDDLTDSLSPWAALTCYSPFPSLSLFFPLLFSLLFRLSISRPYQ